ncbi:hypothetical protein [Aureibacillus halotolerans]|uniref:Uncharacterized protein n=1 Tax=Aureibacillus halotolerans TaxID=1508390 RepID=A0A4R6U990_9BACI|nr:hypothetical protein [Aureibacillus halotolerans]TDQ39634.1 hypothetical protein EV213_1071 [Aureibacillus halotolerans]
MGTMLVIQLLIFLLIIAIFVLSPKMRKGSMKERKIVQCNIAMSVAVLLLFLSFFNELGWMVFGSSFLLLLTSFSAQLRVRRQQH